MVHRGGSKFFEGSMVYGVQVIGLRVGIYNFLTRKFFIFSNYILLFWDGMNGDSEDGG